MRLPLQPRKKPGRRRPGMGTPGTPRTPMSVTRPTKPKRARKMARVARKIAKRYDSIGASNPPTQGKPRR